MSKTFRYAEKRSKRTVDFITKVLKLCKEEGLSIAHEDEHGSFIIYEWNEYDVEWFSEAVEDDSITERKEEECTVKLS